MPAPVNATMRMEDDTQVRARSIGSATSSVYTRPGMSDFRPTHRDCSPRLLCAISCASSGPPSTTASAESGNQAFDEVSRAYLEDVCISGSPPGRPISASTSTTIASTTTRARRSIDGVASARSFRERVAAIDAASLSSGETARSRAVAARDRLAAAHARSRAAVGRRSRHLQQRPHAHRLHHDQAQLCAARGAAPAADRAREGDAGGAGRGEDEPSESAARLHRDRHRADGRQSRVLRDGRGIGVSRP